jgi:hypothetical protein
MTTPVSALPHAWVPNLSIYHISKIFTMRNTVWIEKIKRNLKTTQATTYDNENLKMVHMGKSKFQQNKTK